MTSVMTDYIHISDGGEVSFIPGEMTDNRTTELLPCPFCGGEARVERIGKSGYYYVACNTAYCCDFGKFDTEAEAISAWNTRAERTCEVELKTFIEGEYVPCPYYEYEMGCGGQFRWDEVEPPTHCPNCGRKVVS